MTNSNLQFTKRRRSTTDVIVKEKKKTRQWHRNQNDTVGREVLSPWADKP
jgi:hypothetical protein